MTYADPKLLVMKSRSQRGVSKDAPACTTDAPDWTGGPIGRLLAVTAFAPVFFFGNIFRLQTPWRSGRCLFARLIVAPSVFLSGFSGLFKASEGSPFLRSRRRPWETLVLCPSDLTAAEPRRARREPDVRGPGRELGTEDPRKRQGDRSDVRHKFARLKSPIRRRGLRIADVASPSCLRVSHNACLKSYPFSSRLRGGKRPPSVRRVGAPFIQRCYFC